MEMADERPTAAAPRLRPDPQAAYRGPDLTRAQTEELRARQRVRNRVMLVVLLGLVALFFAVTISRMSQVQDPREWSRPGGIAPVPTAPSR
jgi:hypothetical protein